MTALAAVAAPVGAAVEETESCHWPAQVATMPPVMAGAPEGASAPVEERQKMRTEAAEAVALGFSPADLVFLSLVGLWRR